MTSIKDLIRGVYACTSCPLHKEGQPVIASGPMDAEVMLIGEAPGANEVERGIPFVGQAGKFLNYVLLPEAGLKRDLVRVTNTVLHRPPDNRDPSPEEVEACQPWLEIQIDIVKPKVIVLLGRFAVQAVLGLDKPMKEVHGLFAKKDNRLFMISMHPAAALHQPANRQKLMDCFAVLGRVLKEEQHAT